MIRMVVMGDPARADARFEVRRVLGEGGMGVVYCAFDHRLGRNVALKTLRHPSGRNLYRFKREFRSLADIVHPNLAVLHELHTDGAEWYFTMELVEGVPFIAWVRPAVVDHERLAAALPQLVDGVLALHVCGKLHRDLKPSNVLVTAEGRVVLLDFGLIADVESTHVDITHEQAAVGTPAYMSPEQVRDDPLTEASDWYAVGVMLYEALTGRRPFEGRPEKVMERKQLEAVTPPRDLDPTVPDGLDELCRRLLSREPGDRPDGRAVLAALGRGPSAATLDLERGAIAGPFVGRARELELLREALTASRRHGVAVFVRGDSGMGKTRLVHHFLGELGASTILLEGRCYERESVPYKTLDAVIDALTGRLLRASADALEAMIPRDVAALARLFPAMKRLAIVADRCLRALSPPDPQELRRRAFGALRVLFARLAEQGPVVVAIDDLQWGDADSAVFLAELIHDPEPLPLLLLLVHRLEDDRGVVETVRQPRPGIPAGDVRTIDVGPLPEGDARQLVRSLGGVDDGEIVLREGGGHPLFLAELARSTSLGGGAVPSLEQMIAARIAALPAPHAALLRTVAVAARPIPLELAVAAADVSGVGSELARLRAEHLVRVRHLGDSDRVCVEPYHDRIRAAAVASLAASDHRRIHDGLAHTLEAAGGTPDLEGLVEHWLGAGEPARASGYAVRAARVAAEALAFHRAAELYGLALRHGGDDAAWRRDLQHRRGVALANAGALEAAADAFRDAAAGAPPDVALEMDRLRLEQLLRRGRLDEGLALARTVLGQVGVALPSGPAARRAAMRERIRLRLRGLDFDERLPEQIPPQVARRVAVLYSTASALAFVNPVAGRALQFRFLREALDSGDLSQIAKGMAQEVGYLALPGATSRKRIEEVSRRLDLVTTRIGNPGLTGFAMFLKGVAAFIMGEWREAHGLLDLGSKAMRDHAVGLRWEINLAELYLAATLFYLGETREMARLVPRLLRDAIERGDVYAQHGQRGWRSNVAWLVLGRPDEARAHVAAVAAERRHEEGFHLQHYFELLAQTQIDLYLGDVEAAWQRMQRWWKTLAGSHLLDIQSVRIEALFLRVRVLLGRAFRVDEPERRRLATEARAIARRLDRERAAWAAAYATQIRALLALLDGERADAASGLDAAERAFAACDMGLMAAVVRRRCGELEGGASGAAHVDSAERAMAAQAIADPAAMVRLLCPWPG